MDQTYRQRTGKIICYVILVCLAALIQNTSGLSIEIGGARCFLLLPVCMMIGIGEDERAAALIALFGGMLWDLSSAVHLGFNAIFMCIMCFFGAAFITYILRNTFITNFIFSTLFILLYCFLYWLMFIIIKNVKGAELSLFTFYIPSAIYTIAISPIVYAAIKSIKKKLYTPQNKLFAKQ